MRCVGVPNSSCTDLRATLIYVASTPHTNVTLRLPEPLLRRFRIYAASRDQSMTQLMTEAIQRMVDEDGKAERAKQRMIERMRNSPDRGTHGVITWTRDEIYDRGVR